MSRRLAEPGSKVMQTLKKHASVGIGLVGSQFVSSIHAEALRAVPNAEVLAVMSPTEGHARSFAERHHIPHAFDDLDAMLSREDIGLIVIGAPNIAHCEITVRAARAGKHVIVEKPLCMNLAEADRMIKACDVARVKLMYAEELCFAPKYVRLKQLLDDGALGSPLFVRQAERHDGPHAEHFWDVERSGGGVTMDMGCHAFQFFRWLLPKNRPISVYAQMGTHVHGARTKGDDNAIIIVEFDNGTVCIAEESWTKLGGMDDQAEVHGSEGVAYADLLHGNAIRTYSKSGVGYAVEKAGSTIGWSFVVYEEAWNYGFPQEFQHFVNCIQSGEEPLVTGRDGRAVLEIIFAAYESARLGKKIALPFASDASKPIDLWRGGEVR